MIGRVDPFIGTEVTDLPPQTGLAATWWWPKPQIGNTHPGATYPLGMVSACAYSGAYPTGYGRYDLSLEGIPPLLHERHLASGFAHFQQSGTGAIRKYYNYFRVTPMIEPLDVLGRTWELTDEQAEPGWYSGTLDSGITAELTVGPKSAVHRYTFPAHSKARVVIDFSHGGLSIPYGATIPVRAHLECLEPGVASGEIVVEGAPLSVYIECDNPQWRQMLWYDRRLMPGGTRLDFDHIRPTTLRPFGLMWAGPSEEGQTIELRIGFSLRGVEQAKRNLEADCGTGPAQFTPRRERTQKVWRKKLKGITVRTPSAARQTVFSTALYHALIKPCLAPSESPFWPTDGPFVFDISTMWDIYRTQLPLITALMPERAVELANAMITISEEEGNFPIGYRMARGSDRFSRQASALAHTFLADLCQLGLPGIDWDWALVHMSDDLRRTYGEEFLVHGEAHPISHTLDLAFGYWCTAKVAGHVGDRALVEQFVALAERWVNAYDPVTGLLKDSTYYEGTRHNYSFRLVQDMDARIALSGGAERFIAQLDEFFGYGAEPVKQLVRGSGPEEVVAGYRLGRFEGLNNEPDMEAPWSYHYVGRPDRTAEIVHNIVHQQFGTGRGGLPGNDDSGGLSSWFVWASLGLFPVAGQNIFLVNAPSFEKSTFSVGKHSFTIRTRGFIEPTPGGPVQYVQAMEFNGEPLGRTWLSGNEFHAGGELVVELGPEPGSWGTTDFPPSTPSSLSPSRASRSTGETP
ncbi:MULTISPECIES: glycoside hydrolase domain-containing protein [unclassified Cryobacterium]|uniref:glycoside hydrolase domain-containing protein n=1 Tax=unclassified Cryobacterium TaxID=2649013 RepID=UPI00106B41DE|nr:MULTISPECIES: glycoside hydrolase domain-containing protein [unclassified Cryobacterium]TFB93549.1 glycoside hydrolase [Cryobacterium sp. MDB2-A-1]TFC10076.1 glycoside hydrolase [Cryobacterium sp. MDB2-33-2]TFC11951.1 glycoside hydrolase [Cryobacterium sp. MDB2-A-2]TFC13475.1 glycoside hydrolase [Cryobacterium sp. MDB2-10]